MRRFFAKLTKSRPARRVRPPFRPALEGLEQRQVPSTLVVSNILDSGPGSLRAAVSQANTDAAHGKSDTITFAGRLKGKTITLTQGVLELTAGQGTVTIDGGKNKISLSGGNLFGLFYVEGGAHLSLENLTLEDGYGTAGGGAVCNHGRLTAIGCTFDHNRTDEGGGAIDGDKGSVTVPSGCSFDSNSAVIGGAVYNFAYAAASVGHCTFSQNPAVNVGGAIYNEETGRVAVSACAFNGDSATTVYDPTAGGGAIYNDGAAVVSNSTFSRNSATRGGAIYNDADSTTLAVSASAFSSNTAQDGGAVASASGAWSVSNSSFSGNHADHHGGAIFNEAALTLSGCAFKKNAAEYGGAICNYSDYGAEASLAESQCTFTGNSASIGGNDILNVYGRHHNLMNVDGQVRYHGP
jgi:predicted outer membrane repeat protein